MSARTHLSTLAAASICGLFLTLGSAHGQSEVILPEFTVTDQNGAVVGAFLDMSTRIMLSTSA